MFFAWLSQCLGMALIFFVLQKVLRGAGVRAAPAIFFSLLVALFWLAVGPFSPLLPVLFALAGGY